MKWGYEKGIIYILPVLLIIAFIVLFPLFYNIYLSFHQSSIYSPDLNFVGLNNYIKLFNDQSFIAGFKNTIVWTIGSVFFQILLGLIAALLLWRINYGKRVIQTIIMLPWIVPGIAAAASWRWLYHPDFGLINYIFSLFGFKSILWLGDPDLALAAVIVVNVWKMYPFVALMIMARLQAIPKSVYEAAHLDGGNFWQIFFYITLPMIRSILSVLTLLLSIWAFNSFTFIYAMTGGGPARSSEIIGLKIYRDALKNMMFGQAAAEALVLFAMMLIFSIVYLYYTYNWREESR